jgi:hypothetical protein
LQSVQIGCYFLSLWGISPRWATMIFSNVNKPFLTYRVVWQLRKIKWGTQMVKIPQNVSLCGQWRGCPSQSNRAKSGYTMRLSLGRCSLEDFSYNRISCSIHLCSFLGGLFIYFFFGGTGSWTQALMSAGQTLNYWSHSTSLCSFLKHSHLELLGYYYYKMKYFWWHGTDNNTFQCLHCASEEGAKEKKERSTVVSEFITQMFLFLITEGISVAHRFV